MIMWLKKIFLLLLVSSTLIAEELPFFTIEGGTLSISKKLVYGKVTSKTCPYFPIFSKKEPRKLKKSKRFIYGLSSLRKTSNLDGDLLLIVDDSVGMVGHYFHFMEHMIGIWNFLTYQNPEKVKLVLLAFKSQSNNDHNWKGIANDTTKTLLTSLFPNAKISLFQDLPENLSIKAKKIHISSRVRSHGIKEAAHNNMNGSGRSLYQKARLKKMRDNLFAKLGVKKEERADLFRITYSKRSTGRSLDLRVEEELLTRVERETGFPVAVVDFSDLTFKEQLQIVANTDLLLGAHGNGFTHLLFLPDHASIIEYMQGGESAFFRLFAQARGIQYFANVQERWITGDYMSLDNVGPFQESVTNVDIEGTIDLIKKLSKEPV